MRNELPADFGRIDGGRAVGGHDDGAIGQWMVDVQKWMVVVFEIVVVRKHNRVAVT